MDLFQRIKWASSGTIYDMSKTNYNWGWGFLGGDTPTVQDFNFVQQCNDEKDQWLFNQINEVLKEQGTQATEQEITSLRDAIKKMIKSFEDGLKSPDGFKFIGKCESIEQLRTIEPTEHNQRILVRGYYAGSNVGGGEFYADLSDKATADNGGTVIVTTSENRWKKIYQQITPFDFGAKGDIYINDDDAFNMLEKSISNAPVNLCGCYFLVTEPYSGNVYYNGKFKTSIIGSYSKERMHSGGSLYIRHIGSSSSFIDLEPCLEDGLTEYFQGLYQDPRDGYIWSLQGDAGKPAIDHKCAFVKYAPAYGNVAKPLFHSVPSNAIGHQSFGIQYDEFQRYFWSPAGSALTTERGKYIARHVVDEKTGAVTSNTYLISDTAKGDASNCLCITPNGEFLLATCGVWIGDKQDTYDWRLKVFRISDITATDGTTVPPTVFEFPLYRINSYAVQSIACDGDFVYVQYGDNQLSRNALAVYTIDGSHVLTDLQYFIGINDAKAIIENGGQQYYEPEAIAVFQMGQEYNLVHGYILGEAKNSQNKQFRIFTTSTNKPVFNQTFGNYPQQIFDKGKNIAVPKGKWLTFGEIDELGEWLEIFAMKNGQINAEKKDQSQIQYRIANALRTGFFQISESGNLGIYDSTNNRYLIYSGLDGVPMIAKSPDLAANGDQVPTTYWVNKVIKNAFTQSLTTNGWQKLPNGLIMQWGKITGISNGDGVKGTVSLPLSAKILNVSIGILSANDNDPFILISAVRDGQFDFTKGNAYNSNSDNIEFYWQALTYVA